MTTRTAEANGHRCRYCGGRVKRDLKRRGSSLIRKQRVQ